MNNNVKYQETTKYLVTLLPQYIDKKSAQTGLDS